MAVCSLDAQVRKPLTHVHQEEYPWEARQAKRCHVAAHQQPHYDSQNPGYVCETEQKRRDLEIGISPDTHTDQDLSVSTNERGTGVADVAIPNLYLLKTDAGRLKHLVFEETQHRTKLPVEGR